MHLLNKTEDLKFKAEGEFKSNFIYSRVFFKKVKKLKKNKTAFLQI